MNGLLKTHDRAHAPDPVVIPDAEAPQAAYLTYHVGVGSWEHATAIVSDAQRHDWDGSVYVDSERWVVRLTRFAVPAVPLLNSTRRYVDRLAERHGGRPFACTIEDPLRDDCGDELTERLLVAFAEAEHETPAATAQLRVATPAACG